jgi:pimeloyl-ACP methyl ester carboxylesterase
MTAWQRIHYIWVRAGLLMLVAMPVAMFVMFRAQGLPPDTFASSAELRVTESEMYVRFQPAAAQSAAVALIPGCPADPYAYGPLARALAQRGVLSVIVKVPYRCAPLGSHQAALRQRVSGVLDSCPDCAWTIAGHSRGARHALEVASAMPPGRIASLVLIASTHPREESYATLGMPVLKILASEDGVAPLAAALDNRALLPPTARWEVIDGANHAQFGHYGYQLWDRAATITREQQQEHAVGLILSAVQTKQ